MARKTARRAETSRGRARAVIAPEEGGAPSPRSADRGGASTADSADSPAAGALDRFQRRHTWLGIPVATIYVFVEEQGLYLAAIIAFYGMFSLFPLLLLLSSAVGFFLEGNPDLQSRIIEAAVEFVPMLSESFVRTQLAGSGLSIVLGAAGALLGALGVGTGVQNAMNVVWHVPRYQRPNPFLLRLRSLGILAVLLVFVLVTTFATQVGPLVLGTSLPPVLGGWLGYLLSFLVTTFTFTVITKAAVRRHVSFRERLPGALLGAVLWQLLQSAGAAYVQGYLARTTIASGVFGSLLGVLLWIFLAGAILVLSCVFNVVIVERLYPRSLGVVFYDNRNLTDADRRVFARRAVAQEFKTFQSNEARFRMGEPQPGTPASAPPSEGYAVHEHHAPEQPAGQRPGQTPPPRGTRTRRHPL